MTMQSQLGDSQAMTHNSKFGQLFTHHKISGHLHTGKTTDYRRGNIPISRAYILSCLYHRKAPQILDKMYELCEAKSGYVYNLEVCTVAHPTNSEHNTAFRDVDRLCSKRVIVC